MGKAILFRQQTKRNFTFRSQGNKRLPFKVVFRGDGCVALQHHGQNEGHFHDGKVVSDTHSWSAAKGEISIFMSVGASFWQKSVS